MNNLGTILSLYSSHIVYACKVYIVYMGEKKHDDHRSMVTASHHDVLASVLGRY